MFNNWLCYMKYELKKKHLKTIHKKLIKKVMKFVKPYDMRVF